MNHPDWLIYIGYLASAIIVVSMSMNSIVKFRIINFFGASLFSAYGFLIGAYPVGILNAVIVTIDLYYLYRIFGRKDNFEILEVRSDSVYLLRFLEYHRDEIQKFFPEFGYKPEMNTECFFVLRNMAVAGLFLAHVRADGELRVGLDFVIPEYRDFKNGHFVYSLLRDRFTGKGIHRVTAANSCQDHRKYLKKLGFKELPDGLMEKNL
jgi:hypothetical protein